MFSKLSGKRKHYKRQIAMIITFIMVLMTVLAPVDTRGLAASQPKFERGYTYSYAGTSNTYKLINLKKGYTVQWFIEEKVAGYVGFSKTDKNSLKLQTTVKGTESSVKVYTYKTNKRIGTSYKVTAKLYDTKGKNVATCKDRVKIAIDATSVKIINAPTDKTMLVNSSFNFDLSMEPSNTINKIYWTVKDSEDKIIIDKKEGIASDKALMASNGSFTPLQVGTYTIEANAYRSKTAEKCRNKDSIVITVISDKPATLTPMPTVTPVPNTNPVFPPSGPSTPTVTPTATPTPTVTPAVVDTDSDGLPDDLEKLLGTDEKNADTDGDKLSDGLEYSLGLNPLNKDSDGNGITDDNEDSDADRLTNLEEIIGGSNPAMLDSDSDRLSDYDELKLNGTSPINRDTDGDTLSDYEETRLGLDPLKAMSDGVTPDALRTFVQTLPEENYDESLFSNEELVIHGITANVSGLIGDNIFVSVSSNDAFDDNRAVFGAPMDIDTGYPEGVTLDFSLNVSNLVGSYGVEFARDLLVCRIGGDDGLTPISTTFEDNIITATIPAGGSYLVINANEFLLNFGIDVLGSLTEKVPDLEVPEEVPMAAFADSMPIPTIDEPYTVDNNVSVVSPAAIEFDMAMSSAMLSEELAPELAAMTATTGSTMGMADVVFVLDATGSMGDEIYNVATNINSFADQLVNVYNVNANFGLVEFQDITCDGLDSTIIHKNGTSNWYSDVLKFKSAVNQIYAKSGGDEPECDIDGLETARRLDWRQAASKFVILLTDASYKVDNRFGIESMDEMIDLFQADGIMVSVITSSYQEIQYRSLYTETGGIYANIYGDFSSALITLADKIGDITSKGTWVILDDYQVVRLADVSEPNYGDTDGDGIEDYTELGVARTINLEWAIQKVREAHNILPEAVYSGKTSVEVYNYLTNPTLADTDYDGMSDNDSSDLVKRDKGDIDGNAFGGNAQANGFGFNVEFSVDYRDFFKDNTLYNNDLGVLGSIYSTIIYEGTNLDITSGTVDSGAIENAMDKFGLLNVERENLRTEFHDDDISELVIGHRPVSYKGRNREVIVVSVRGTNGTIQEWSSNFDVGADTADYWDIENIDWRDHQNHKGFDVTANRLYDKIIEYVNTNVTSGNEKVIYIVGHSRGAAISNILGKLFEESMDYTSFVYTYATPNTTTSATASSYRTIFNVVNSDDLIPYMPLQEWGFSKYGITKTISVHDKYENHWGGAEVGTWEWLFGPDYNDDGGTKRTLNAFKKLAASREDIYKYTCEDHGDGTSDDNIQYLNLVAYFSSTDADKAMNDLLASYTDRMKHYVEVEVTDEPLLGVHKYFVTSHQTPAFFMMCLAELAVSHDPFKYNVAPAYQDAKTSFVVSALEFASIGGLTHPHMPGTYYLINHNKIQPLK